MKVIFFSFLSLLVLTTDGQKLSADNLLTTTTLPIPKMESYLSKNGYVFAGKEELNDTILNTYSYKKAFNKKDKIIIPDSATRIFYREDVAGFSSINYQTSSLSEFIDLVGQIRNKGFFSYRSIDSLLTAPMLFQHNDVKINTFFKVADSVKNYCVQVQKYLLPGPSNLNFADDLLAFKSQECLEFYFGKNNVKSDIYYFSKNETIKCTVLFLNTNRQVVFVWQDEENKCTIRQLLFGGQQRLESSKDNDNFVAENNWSFKSGLRAGMPLIALRKLNENDFKFYGGSSARFGHILPDTTGKIDFKKQAVILSCMNCRDDKFLSPPVIDADDAIADDRILFVLSVVLNP